MSTKKPKTKIQTVAVLWTDATSHDRWEDIDEAKKLELAKINTLGTMIYEDAEKIIVALSIDEDLEQVSQTLAIPKAWIQRIRRIKA
jgi:hypothetical protein